MDFGLRQESWSYPFVFVQITDTHEAYDTWPAIRKECDAMPLKPKFYVFTGDLGNDDPSVHNMPMLHQMFGRMRENVENFGAPFFMVPGNHDTVGYGGSGAEVITPEAARQPFFDNGCMGALRRPELLVLLGTATCTSWASSGACGKASGPPRRRRPARG